MKLIVNIFIFYLLILEKYTFILSLDFCIGTHSVNKYLRLLKVNRERIVYDFKFRV